MIYKTYQIYYALRKLKSFYSKMQIRIFLIQKGYFIKRQRKRLNKVFAL